MIFKIWPQLLMMLFNFWMLQTEYKVHSQKKSLLTQRKFYNLIIAIVVLNIVLFFGGFYNAVWE